MITKNYSNSIIHKKSYHPQIGNLLINNQKTLRVRIHNLLVVSEKVCHKDSKVILQGSLSLEAALALPLFLFSMLILMMPLGIMNATRQMQAVAEEVAKDASRYAYLMTYDSEEIDDIRHDDEDAFDINLENYLIGGAIGAYASEKAKDMISSKRIESINFLSSSFMKDGQMVTVQLDYSYKLPFSVLGLGNVKQSVVASRRAWIGKDGGTGFGENKEEDDEIVYVGKNSTRYHLSATCHYLYNDLKSVSLADISTLRNTYGGKYYPCSRCAGNATGNVYVLPSGTAYHTSSSCTAIIAYVKAVHKSTVEHLGVCSYCGGQ